MNKTLIRFLGAAVLIVTFVSVDSSAADNFFSRFFSHNRITFIQAKATDPAGVSKVEFYVNKVLTCTVSRAPYFCAWRVPAGAGVQYQLQTVAYNNLGKTGASPAVMVTSR